MAHICGPVQFVQPDLHPLNRVVQQAGLGWSYKQTQDSVESCCFVAASAQAPGCTAGDVFQSVCQLLSVVCLARSVKIAALEVAVGDVVVVAAADDEEEGVEPPLALLQALWQTAKGQYTTFVCA